MYPHLFYRRYTQATLTLSEHNKEVNIMGTNKQNVNTLEMLMKGGEEMEKIENIIKKIQSDEEGIVKYEAPKTTLTEITLDEITCDLTTDTPFKSCDYIFTTLDGKRYIITEGLMYTTQYYVFYKRLRQLAGILGTTLNKAMSEAIGKTFKVRLTRTVSKTDPDKVFFNIEFLSLAEKAVK